MPTINTFTKREQTKHIERDLVNKNELSLIEEIRHKIVTEHALLIHRISEGADKEPLLKEIKKMIDTYPYGDKERIFQEINNFMYGYGILQDLITDDTISDIDFTRYNYCTIKRNGVKEEGNISFINTKEFQDFAMLMIARNGGIIDENNTHCRVSDEKYRLRINVSIPPRNVTGASMITRKHPIHPYNLDDLVKLNMLTEKQKEFLICNEKNLSLNLIICGKGASGKTTLLRAILMEAYPMNTYLVCEKDTELYMNDYDNFVIQRIKKKELGGVKVELEDLVREGLTMSVDCMVVGEIVDSEAYSLIKAGSTDHKIRATLHSKGAEAAINRLITLMESADKKIPIHTLKAITSQAVDIIIYMSDFKVQQIVKVQGYNREKDTFEFVDITEGGAEHAK
ncbi:CpaF family protein (plasmid) [Vallitalea pronyensis]|uniref:CpaF family protein n=1 Tax=Vallitalea pronyensis TaxID=1348613 RepID=A0A8J8MR58_9FIRM|nr:ATPase, T2SS/T4P/T4SS family [Vallitalea pronyensis]QUI25908.1 CpaF family protein [Vallitalea pronyensis]